MNYLTALSFLLTKPKSVYLFVLTVVIAALIAIPQIKIDTDPENMLSEDNPARLIHNQIKTDFVMRDMVVVGAVAPNSLFSPEYLKALHALSLYVQGIEGVIEQDLLSLSVVDNISQSIDGGIKFEYLMREAPSTLVDSVAIQHAVQRLPLLDNTLVSHDGKAIAIYVPLQQKSLSYQVAENIRHYLTNLEKPRDMAFHITGLPVAEDQFGVEMFVQMGIAAPLAGMAIFLLLWLFFRNVTLIFAPMIVAMATVIIIMGALIGLGFTVHIMSSMIAIFLMPIAVVDSVHILSEFADRYNEKQDVNQLVKKIMSHLFTPMLYTSVTSAIGFFSLLLTPIPPVQVFGAFIGSGILLAFVLTVIFVPVYLTRLSPATLAKLHLVSLQFKQGGLLTKSLVVIGNIGRKRAKFVLIGFSALVAFSVFGIAKIEINDNPVNWFKADHEIRIADKVLNQHFAGTYDAWLVFKQIQPQEQPLVGEFNELISQIKTYQQQGDISFDPLLQLIHNTSAETLFDNSLLVMLDDLAFATSGEATAVVERLYQIAQQIINNQQVFKQPELLNWLDDLQQALLQTGLVGKTNGLVDIVKTVNRELVSGKAGDFTIPTSSAGVAQTLLQYQSSHRPNDLWHFVSKDYQQSLLWLQLTSGDNQHTTKVVDWVNRYLVEHPAPIAIEAQWAGKSYLNIVWQDAMVNGMISSLLSSFVIVFLMMALLFRSFIYGVLAMLPLTVTISFIYGLIGWFGKAYDMPIAVLSALTLGLSIDFAIHFLQRVRELAKEHGSMVKALNEMFDEPARAIARNAIVIAIGFTPLLLSPLIPYITVGFFLASIMAVSALVTLLLLPALLSLGKRFK